MRSFLLFLAFIVVSAIGFSQNSFTSVQDGDWDDESTWFASGGAGGTEGVDYPSPYDSVFINHDVDIVSTNSGANFIFEGYLEVSAGEKLQCEIGNSNNGFQLQGDGQMHVFGSFYTASAGQGPSTGSPNAREFTVTGDAFFLAYTGSDIYVSDDWQIEENCTIYIQTNVCVRVHDDVNFDGTGWYMCGDGDISIGGDGASSTVSFSGGASASQICSSSDVYRNTSGVTCTGTDLTSGSASDGPPPFAYDDFYSTNYNTAINLDVLYQGTDDRSIIIGDTITLTSAGDNGAANNGASTQGGTVTVSTNGTPNDLTDDYILYNPPVNFTGTDDFQYVITNEDGVTATATVTVNVACAGGQFVEMAADVGLNLGGNKDGGLTWYDLNRDKLLDVIVNTDDNTNDTRIYFQQNDGTFTDVTSTHAAALLSNNCERTVVAADFNNDGYVEFVRNAFNRVEVWQNDGPSASPAYSFSLVETYTSNNEGINVEGIGIVDWNQDGYLDLIMDSDDSEIVLYENDQDGTFTEQTSGTGLPTGDNGVGDYSTALDWNNDGFMDYAARKSDGGTGDFWEFNSGTNQFSEVDPPNLATSGGEKGAITFCDLDQDGDFDFIWAHQSNDNQITIYTQGSDGSFNAAITLETDAGVEECDCADVDNDGDLDIFLGDDGQDSYLYINNTIKGASLSFSQDNGCIDPDDDVEGSEFVDFDADGDMDLYMNINGAANQLWQNSQNDSNYLFVEPRVLLGGSGNWRPATGANVMLIACSDTCLIQDVSGGRGHGSQKPGRVHFGLGGSLFGPSQEYSIAVFFPDSNGTRDTVIRTIVPSQVQNQTLIVYQNEVSDTLCVGVDSDGDGVADAQDPDDDNDGVLDVNECLGELVVTNETGFFTSANLTFTVNGNISDRTDPQVLQAIAVLGTNYNEFILPDSLDIEYNSASFDESDARFLDGGASQSQLSVAGEASYEVTGLLSFQDPDLNHYQMLDTPVDSADDYYDVYYDVPILSNGKVYVAFSERGGNNRFAFEAYAPDGTPYNQRVELALTDYIDSGYPVAALGGGGSQNAEIAVLPITDLAPLGETVGRIRTIPFTSGSDAGDGKIFIFGTLSFLDGSCDTDGDGVTNGMDLDSDNDGIPDLVESGGVDENGDGVADDTTDTDMDGLVDQFDTTNGGTLLPIIDSDLDGVYDKNDIDSDDDGISDVNEIGGTDENGDGRADDYVDTDGDGYGDVLDGDVGNDGTAENSANSLVLTGPDTDNDSRPNSYTEGDFDGDLYLNHVDIDSDGDGITDLIEVGGIDIDSNGRFDNYVDNDNDGFNDLVDGDSTNALAVGSDVDGNNADSALIKTSADANLDGLPDSYPSGDSDGDGNRDLLDIDSDNDGITDNSEGISTAGYTAPSGNDTDGDGLDDSYDPDNSGSYAYPTDTDSDNTPDYLDDDSDDDGLTDDREGHDSDGNGQADAGSPSNTGFSGGTTDADGDGLYDGWDNNTSSTDATNTNVAPNSHPDTVNVGNDRDWREIRDWDGDGIGDLNDYDDDNDGVLDDDENGSNEPDGDEDGDGILNWLDTTDDGNGGDGSTTSYVDNNSDGIPDVYDFDEDGIPNHLDLDSDNDGITDLAENASGTGVDANNDGIVDGSADADNDGVLDSADSNDSSAGSPGSGIEDTDGDGNPDSQDLDSDNDGITDLAENPDGTGIDLNNDGVVDGAIDSDRDGILDSADGDDANAGSPNSNPTDSDGDGVYDAIDLDSDNDGITDLAEHTNGSGVDSNNDGIVDGSSDTDGDGILNSADSDDSNLGSPNSPNTDLDGDGLANSVDIDADNDGITDIREDLNGSGTDANNDGIVDGTADTDGDGILNSADTDDSNNGSPNSAPNDSDSDGLYDFVDIDADDDGIVDLIEAQLTSGSPTVPSGSDTDGDGLDNNFENTGLVPIDTDGDTTPDYLDSDSDDDGESDLIEGWDTDGDGTPETTPANNDADGDGLDDNFDDYNNATPNEVTNPTNNNQDALDFPDEDEGGNERDWREVPCAGGDATLSALNTTTVASDYCVEGGWTYYYNPSDSTEILFAIEHTPVGGNTNDFTASVSLTVSSDPDTEPGVYSAEDAGNEEATFVMGRYWNVTITSGSLNGDVNVRFFYDTNDADTLEAVAERWNDANAGSTSFVSGRRWFLMNSGTFDDATADLQPDGINASSELFPSTTSALDGTTYVQFDGLSSLTGGGLGYSIGTNSVILPVELINFTARLVDGEVLCEWITGNEINSDYFDVERSSEQGVWESIGTKQAAGHSNDILHYSMIDRRPTPGHSFYRLKTIDLDQSFELSVERPIHVDSESEEIVVYPNPNSGRFVVGMSSSQIEALTIYNAAGQRIKFQVVSLGEGQTEIHMNQLSAGMYFLKIETPTATKLVPFVLQ